MEKTVWDTVFPTDAHNKRFNRTLPNEELNAEWFHTVNQAQTAINVWLSTNTITSDHIMV
jgi:hypothetical protein